MSDIFSEVDEEVRREQLRKLWERYGFLLIAACVLLVAGVAGWRGYEWWEAKWAAEAGNALVGYETEKALANVVLLSEIPTTYDKDQKRQVNAGNLLLKGVPGVGKTFFGVILAAISNARFARLQDVREKPIGLAPCRQEVGSRRLSQHIADRTE